MKASKLLKEIQAAIKDYPIDYLKNKVTDDRYKDKLTKELARYNSNAYDNIMDYTIEEDFDINDKVINNLKLDVDAYFNIYNPHDKENQKFTKYLSLYYAFLSKMPLHPYGENPKTDEVYILDNNYYCKGRAKYIKENKSLCKYCPCKNASFNHLF